MTTRPSRVAVIFGGPSPEHDVSVLTGLQAAHVLGEAPNIESCEALYWAKTGAWFEVPSTLEASAFANGIPSSAKPIEFVAAREGGFVRRRRMSGRGESIGFDAAVNCCHGGPGEDGRLQGALDLAGIAYSGPSAFGAMLGMDKFATGALLSAAGLPTLPRVVLDASTPEVSFPGPYIVKPRYGGSSIGIEVVADLPTARARVSANVHLRDGAVLEPYRSEFFDLEIATRSFPERTFSAIARPIRRNAGAEILNYADKYVGSEGMASAPRELPAVLSSGARDKVNEFAAIAAEVLNVRGVARIDFLSDGNELYVNEINTIPGSLGRYLFIDPPVRFEDLLIGLLTEATERPTAQFSSVGADGTVLRDAVLIASKLG